MSISSAPGALNDAMTQRDRLALTPDPAQAPVDGRSLADLLRFAAEYGALVQFVDVDNVPAGDWTVFFENDPSIALALYAALDLADIELQLDRLLDALRQAGGTEQRLAHWAALSAAMARLIGLAGDSGGAASLQAALVQVVARRAPAALLEPAAHLSRHFGSDMAEQRLRRERADSGWLLELLALLEECLAALLLALQRARDHAVASLDASLRDGQHAPQSGLWDAFAQLFRHAQHSVNRFPARLLNFYQKQVLRQETREGAADQLVLAFAPAAGVTQTTLDQGTAFLAGTDADGLPITYALDAALTVAATSVTALRTVTLAPVPADPLAAIPAPGGLVLSGEVALSATAPAIGAPFPLFGADQVGVDGALVSSKASLGFAVAGDSLLLAGGRRQVALELTFATAPETAMAGLAPSSAAAALARILEQAFALRYSTPTGWAAIHDYRVTPPAAGDGPFVLSFELDADAAAWARYPAADPGAADATAPWSGLPTLHAALVQAPVQVPVQAGADDLTIYPYVLLSRLRVMALALRVNVRGLDQLQLSGPGGPLDPSMPFTVFGSPPVRYASLSVSAPELFAKQLSCLSMTITWFGLPVASTGFAGYYQGYVINANGETVAPGTLFNNNIFTAGMAVVNPGTWTLRSGPPFQRLFQTGPMPIEPPPLQAWTTLREPVLARPADHYYDPAMSAVRLRLEAPSYAFGDILYAPNVMAASLQLTAAAAACAAQCGSTAADGSAGDPLAAMLRACDEGDYAGFHERVAAALPAALSGLDGVALNWLESAIGQGSASPAQQRAWLDSLHQALRKSDDGALAQRLGQPGAVPPEGSTVHDNLRQWLDQYAPALVPSCPPAMVAAAQVVLAAGDVLLTAAALAADAPPTVARPELAATVRRLQDDCHQAQRACSDDCIQQCMREAAMPPFPNQPWLPMAQSLHVDYSAAAFLPSAVGQPGATPLRFVHLCPFGQAEAQDWQAGHSVPLLAPLAGAGALEIVLSAPASSLSLLFQLSQPAGGWPIDTELPSWQQLVAGSWQSLQPQRDSTNGLRQSGIVNFALAAQPADLPLRLRVAYAHGDAARYPLLSGLLANAASATWQGPGGAAGLGTPLPAGSITQAVTSLPEIGAIDQPEPSFGGRAKASGAAFDLWLAERLRHKDYAIQAWDYASVVLAAFPSLWQVAVVAASNGAGAPGSAPGQVWIVAVPGPDTPGVDDPATPSCTGQALSDIAAWLAPRISPFIELNVTNPPYVRLTVQADLLFTSDAAVGACISRLNEELIAYLSPWPTPGGVPRARNYYSYQEVARFIRQRPYVKAIRELQLTGAGTAPIHPYYTSAASHQIQGRAVPASALLRQPGFTLPGAAPASLGERA
jgi:hypothetical protein